jgi:predicted transcriptional regulator
MYPACDLVARFILPIYRSLIAKDLIEKYRFTQITVAKHLGTTQAAISQYMNSKRGHKDIKQFETFIPLIQSIASETAKSIAFENLKEEKIMANFCKLCKTMREDLHFSKSNS